MHVDAAVEAGQRPPQPLLGELRLADHPASVAGEELEQVELGAGQRQRLPLPLGAAHLRPHHQRADAHRAVGGLGAGGLAAAAQDRPQPGHQLARGARLGHVVVGAQFEADDAIHVVAPGGQHQHRHLAVGTDAAQGLDAVEARHHHVEHDNGVLPRQRRRDARLAIVANLHREALAPDVLLQHRRQLDVVVHQQNFVHRAPDRPQWADDTGRAPADTTPLRRFTQRQRPLTPRSEMLRPSARPARPEPTGP